MFKNIKSVQFATLVSAAIIVSFFILFPGVTGQFQLDDWGTLPRLFDDIEINGFWHAVFNGISGPTGRPITLFSFALQQNQWNNPYHFILLNIFIHLLNAILVGLFTFLLIRNFPLIPKHKIPMFAVVVAFIWAILPIQISSILYVVQRMVLLSTLFTLLALIGYLLGRQYLVAGRLRLGYTHITLLVGGFSLLALFSKETGYLTVFYIWVIELFLGKRIVINTKLFDIWKVLFFIVPLVAFVTYILLNAETFFLDSYQNRSFSLLERVLTQPSVLWAYVNEIILPQASSLSLYHENFPISKSLLNPPYTLLSIIAWLTLLIIAYRTRDKLPIILFCVLWFLTGHAMESSFISLEIYFEHRNYLPSFSIVFALVYFIFVSDNHIDSTLLKSIFRIAVVFYSIFLISITYKQSENWGKPLEFAYVQSIEHPHSLRARLALLHTISKPSLTRQKPDILINEINRLQHDFAGIASVELHGMVYRCYSDKIKLVPLNSIEDKLLKAPFEHSVIKLLDDTLAHKLEQHCDNIPFEYLENVLLIFLKNPAFINHAEKFKYLLANIYINQKNDGGAIRMLDSIKIKSFSTRLYLANILATDHKFEKALQELDAAEKQLKPNENFENNMSQLTELRKSIKLDINANQ